jgi:hypothetical protein
MVRDLSVLFGQAVQARRDAGGRNTHRDVEQGNQLIDLRYSGVVWSSRSASDDSLRLALFNRIGAQVER